jgi:transcriptional regulator with XRE-family HTH domain
MEKIVSVMRLTRIALAYTLRDLSELTGIDTAYLSRIERRKMKAENHQQRLIAEVLKCKPHVLFKKATTDDASYVRLLKE